MFVLDTLISKYILFDSKINSFRGELTDISAEKAFLMQVTRTAELKGVSQSDSCVLTITIVPNTQHAGTCFKVMYVKVRADS